MSRLPEEFVRQGLELAKGATLFGVPMSELTPEELMAACAQGWKAYNDKLRDGLRLTADDWDRGCPGFGDLRE